MTKMNKVNVPKGLQTDEIPHNSVVLNLPNAASL